MATELILIRHGNAVRVNGDYFHAPLTSIGQEQAARTGQYFSASQNQPSAPRAGNSQHIGAKIGQNAELKNGIQEVRATEVPALVVLEILSITDLVEDYLDARAGSPIRWPIEGRVSAVLLAILARHPNQRVGVVAHAGVISAALSWYLPEKRWRWWRTTVSNCSITRFRVEGITTQPPTMAVEVAKQAHPAEKALVFDKPPDKNIGAPPAG